MPHTANGRAHGAIVTRTSQNPVRAGRARKRVRDRRHRRVHDARCGLLPHAINQMGSCATRQGEQWHRILDAAATPCYPNSLFFDPDEPDGRALYVACSQRGILKILGIPRESDQDRLDESSATMHVVRQQTAVPGGLPAQADSYQESPAEDFHESGAPASGLGILTHGIEGNTPPK
jgi:hypothetical protein